MALAHEKLGKFGRFFYSKGITNISTSVTPAQAGAQAFKNNKKRGSRIEVRDDKRGRFNKDSK